MTHRAKVYGPILLVALAAAASIGQTPSLSNRPDQPAPRGSQSVNDAPKKNTESFTAQRRAADKATDAPTANEAAPAGAPRGIPLPGDECATAIPIVCGASLVVGNVTATENGGDPPFSCHAGGVPANGFGTLWFNFVAADASARVRTCASPGANLDSLLAVYGGDCGSLTELGCNDDACGATGLLSEVCVDNLVVGRTYYVQLASYAGIHQGTYTIELECACKCFPVEFCCTGDVDGNGQINGRDVQAFAAGLLSPPPCGSQAACMLDADGDGRVTPGDVGPFVAILLSKSVCQTCGCPPGAINEGESCGTSTNAGCSGQPAAFIPLACGQTVCGTTWAHNGARDTDWYRVDVPNLGNGEGKLTMRLKAEAPNVAVLFPFGCPPPVALTSIESSQCTEDVETICIAAGAYSVFVAPGTIAGGPIFFNNPCDSDNDYTLAVACEPCPPPQVGCLTCPMGSIQEPEPCAGPGANDGCNVTPAVFGMIACGQTICGTARADAGVRDSDWYTYVHAGGPVTATLTSEFPGIVLFVTAPCPAGMVGGTNIGSSNNCSTIIPATAANLLAGTYRVFVAPALSNGTPIFSGYPCSGGNTDYKLVLTCP